MRGQDAPLQQDARVVMLEAADFASCRTQQRLKIHVCLAFSALGWQGITPGGPGPGGRSNGAAQ